MRRMLVSVCVLMFILAATSAFADKEVTVKPVTITPTPIILSTSGLTVGCQVGNLNPAQWAIGDFMLPPEEYKLVFDPRATCSACDVGFLVHTVHILIQSAEACELIMDVNVEEASYPTSPDCPEPGPVLCVSDPFQVSLPGAGLFDIALPIQCGCFTMDRLYLLSFFIDSFSCATTPDLITDAGPATLCTNWNNYGAGWTDLLATFPTWPGNLVFYADAECCTPPVPVDEKTWGAIKALYED